VYTIFSVCDYESLPIFFSFSFLILQILYRMEGVLHLTTLFFPLVFAHLIRDEKSGNGFSFPTIFFFFSFHVVNDAPPYILLILPIFQP